MNQLRKVVIVVAMLFGVSLRAEAQAVVAPTSVNFGQSDTDYTGTLSARLDFYQCASVAMVGTPPVATCVGQAGAPFQVGVDVPKAQIQTLSPPNSFGNNRTFSLTVAPANGLLQATPAGVPFVATLIVNGDPAMGLGTSPRSAASNPFFGSARTPAAAGSLRVQ